MNAVIYFQVIDPEMAVVKVLDYVRATSQIAQTTLRSVLGQSELDELLAQRDQINQQLQQIIDEQTEPWGVKVSVVEVKDVELPQSMQRAMAKQAEAEREKRAKIIHAEGEFEASARLADAADMLNRIRHGAAAPLPADADRDRGREELDHHLPGADRHDHGANVGGGQAERSCPSGRATQDGRAIGRVARSRTAGYGPTTGRIPFRRDWCRACGQAGHEPRVRGERMHIHD